MYRGTRDEFGLEVRKANGTFLNPRLDLRQHSPDGFECGYSGSGPSQLALAVLCDHLKDDDLARKLYIPFRDKVIARLPRTMDKDWVLTTEEVANAITELREKLHI